MLDGNSDAIESSLERLRLSGSGSPLLDSAAVDSVGAADDDDSDDSVGASDDDSAEVGVEEPALCGFWVLAPHADATMPATASAAITEVTRVKRDIDSYLPMTKVLVR
jgi:hypothetical protein